MDPTTEAAKLCKYCQVLSFNDSDPRFKYTEVGTQYSDTSVSLDYEINDSLPDLPFLLESAQGGCDFCRLLRDTILSQDSAADGKLRQFLAEKQQCDVLLSLEYRWMSPQDCHSKSSSASRIMILTVLLDTEHYDTDRSDYDGRDSSSYMTFDFLIEGCKGHDKVTRWLQLHSSTSCGDRLHHSVISWVKSQIEICASEHSHSSLTEEFCPARLLDVHSEPIRLVEYHDIQNAAGKPESPSVRYTALNYCWGNDDQSQQQLLTTKENLPDRLVGITEQQLTPVLRDAVLATRLLSIRYLWVDSLCILQGDRQDWENQSAKMEEIYRNACVTVATPVSGSCGQGFRHTTRKKLYISFRSLLNPDVCGRFSMGYLGCNIDRRTSRLNYNHIYMTNVEFSRWASRGWTFQEMLMSTRLLLFGPAEIFFRCDESTSCLWGHWEEGYSFRFHEGLDRFEWFSILRGYGDLYQGFSCPTDILPALSGIATLFCKRMQYLNDDYVAGLWKDTLFAGLAWHISDIRPVKQRSLPELIASLESPAMNLSPSWAWPGRGGLEFVNAAYSKESLISRCTIQAYVSVKGDNSFGEVEDGIVRLTGKVAELDSDLILSEAPYIRCLRPWISASNDGHPWWFHLDWDPWDDLELRGKLKMVFTGSGIDEQRQTGYFGILIQENKMSPEVRYYRVGSFMSRPVDRHSYNSAEQFFDKCITQTVNII